MAATYAVRHSEALWSRDLVTGALGALPNTDFQVFVAGTTIPATIYSGRDKVPYTGTLRTDDDGNATIWVDPGYYDIKVGDGDPVGMGLIAEDPADTLSPDQIGVPGGVAGFNTEGGYSPPAGGIPYVGLAVPVQTTLDLADTALQTVPPATAQTTGGIRITGDLDGTYDAITVPALDDKYEKPVLGIPYADLTLNVKTSLDKADAAIPANTKGVANGVASLNSSGKLESAQLPALTTSSVFAVADQAARLALSTAVVGDIARQVDNSTSYILATLPPATNGNWLTISAPSGVVSVNGEEGTLTNYVKTTTQAFLDHGTDIDAIKTNTTTGLPSKVSTTSLTTTLNDYVKSDATILTADRNPTDGSVTLAKLHPTFNLAENKVTLANDAAPGVASRRTLGTGANQALPGNHISTTNERTPPDGTVTVNKVPDAALTIAKTANLQTTLNGKYTKPSTGVPLADLETGVQTSLAGATQARAPGVTYGAPSYNATTKLVSVPVTFSEWGYDPAGVNAVVGDHVVNFPKYVFDVNGVIGSAQVATFEPTTMSVASVTGAP